jgi:predicted DNA-binding transcriptional regulator AlpA
MKILKVKEVALLTGLSRTTLWRLEQRGEFPKKIVLTLRRRGWLESEMLNWISSRPRIGKQNELGIASKKEVSK